MNNNYLESTTVYIGNTRAVSNEYLQEYCSKFGFVTECSHRLSSPEQSYLVDFTFVRFLNIQSSKSFLSKQSHILTNGIVLDVRPFDEILHIAVPLDVDRKICIENISNQITLNELKKYLRTFGAIKHAEMQTKDDEKKYIYVEFESAASRNKLLKGKIKQHRLNNFALKISPLLRPTDVDIYQIEGKKISNSTTFISDPNVINDLQNQYNLKIREAFDRIEFEISEFIEQKRQDYERIKKSLQ